MAGFKLTRRKFLVAGALVGGGLAIGYGFRSDEPENAALSTTTKDGEIALNAWLRIDTDGQVTVAIPRTEMGQGVYTALAMLVAEELDADFSAIKVAQAPVADVYVNATVLQDGLIPLSDDYHKGEDTVMGSTMKSMGKMLGIQVTGGSSSVRDAWMPMRQAGAAAKAMLVDAAAKSWSVRARECIVKNGIISHPGSGKSGGFGDFIIEAAKLTPPASVPLKPAKDFSLIGTPQQRLDIPSKVTGSSQFGIDVDLPDMAYAAVTLCPVFGGTLASHDAAAIKGMPGVIDVVPFETGVAVIADSFWRAKTAVEALPVTFDKGENVTLTTSRAVKTLEGNLKDGGSWSYADTGDTKAALKGAADKVESVYRAPYLAHACLEPMNCTAKVSEKGVEIWMPNQIPTLIKWFAAQAADVPSENVKVHTTLVGGGFGRRLEIDLMVMAVTIAKALPGRPVKLLWTRENDTQHDMYRPASVTSFAASLTNDGKIDAWHNRIASQSIGYSFTKRLLPWAAADIPDNTTAEGAADLPYDFANQLVEHVPVVLPVPVGYWRSVGHSGNAFMTESFMDEMAGKAGKDPLDFRLAHLDKAPDYADILKKASEISDWKTPLGPGRARGVALHESFGSIVAQIAEITVTGDKSVTVDKVFCVVDCGVAVNPDTIKAQMEVVILFGLSAAFYGEITLENGRVVNENFPDYDMVRLANAPQIEVHILQSGRPMGGIGEPGTPPIAPAVTNAIFAATGERIRELPLSKMGYTV